MWIETLNKWKNEKQACVLASVIKTEGSAPRGSGTHMVINARGASAGTLGGGPVEHIVVQHAKEIFRKREPETLRFSLKGDKWQVTEQYEIESLCGGYQEVLMEPILPSLEVVIFGGGHIAKYIAGLCAAMGEPYRIYDNRPEFASTERFPDAEECICAPYEEAAERLELSASSCCVILTHGHSFDQCVLGQLLPQQQIPYIGMIGSAHKIEVCLNNLIQEGITIDERLYSPIGLDIGNHAPNEIALSILAEIHLLFSGGSAEHGRKNWHETLNQEKTDACAVA